MNAGVPDHDRDHYRDHYRKEFARRQARPGEDLPWMRHTRDAALERFLALGFPTTRDEDWKYTSVAAIEKRNFSSVPVSLDGVSAEQVQRLAFPGSHRLAFVNGRYAAALSCIDALPRGAVVTNLAAALAAHPERLEAWLAPDTHTETGSNGFAALNAAFWADGAYIDLAAGVSVEQPIHLLFITSEADLATHPRNLVHAAAGAHAVIIEHHVGAEDASYLTNALTQIRADTGAVLTHIKLQQESLRGFHIAAIQAQQAQDSRWTSHSFALGGLLSRSDIATRLEAPGSAADLIGLYLADGRQHMDHHTRIDHASPHGTSRELYKGVLDGASRAVFNGRVIVHPDAQQTDAQQVNRNLLLSERAEVDSKPQLEIYADDVKCSHGATVAQLDPDQVFYLRSRGMDDASARALLVFGFAEEVVERVEFTPLRTRLEGLLRGRLPEDLRMLQ